MIHCAMGCNSLSLKLECRSSRHSGHFSHRGTHHPARSGRQHAPSALDRKSARQSSLIRVQAIHATAGLFTASHSAHPTSRTTMAGPRRRGATALGAPVGGHCPNRMASNWSLSAAGVSAIGTSNGPSPTSGANAGSISQTWPPCHGGVKLCTASSWPRNIPIRPCSALARRVG